MRSEITSHTNGVECVEPRPAESDDLLRRAIDAAQLGICDWDTVTGAIGWAGHATEITGRCESSLPETMDALLALIHENDRSSIAGALAGVARQGESFAAECGILRPDGAVRWVAVRAQAQACEMDGPSRAVLVMHDITERREAEEARMRREAELRHELKDNSLAALAGGIANDFNNLLVGMLGNAELALDQLPADAPPRRAVERIELAALRAADLARQMLAYAGKGQFPVETVDLSRLVDQISTLVAATIGGRARYSFDLQPDLPPVDADPTQLRQVVLNLVTNAVEAIGSGGGTVQVRTGTERLDRGKSGVDQFVYVEVEDTGKGMDEATRARIFEPFFTTKLQGRGLGLPTVLGSVRSHNGVVAVESTVGTGTRIRVSLPRASGAERPRFAAPVETDDRERHSGTVLVVDDEVVVRDMLHDDLSFHGYAVLRAASGVEGVEIYTATAEVVDVVVIDLVMPNMSGVEVLKRMREVRPDVRAVLMSGSDEADVLSKFADPGRIRYLQKPFRLSELRAAIAQAAHA